MSLESLKRYEYCLSNITTSEGACSNPQITWVEKPGVFISCTGTCVTVSFADDYTDPKCIKLFIQCDTCYACEPLEKDLCFCTNSDNCGPCEVCNSEGYCESRCADGEVCNETLDTCVGCTADTDCEGDKKCQAGQCKCPPATPYDLGGGRCGDCLGKADCKAKYGECAECIDNHCVVTDCQYGVCDPVTGECAECVNSGHCTGDNQCCVDKKCVCCPGYVYDAATGGCKEAPECTGDDCGPCGICVLGKCVPRQCPEGKVCIEGECVEQCDCNNPASCTNKGNICKNINGVCGCVSCGAGCSTGCIAGCHCEGTSCVVDPCHGECDDAADCGSGCGCDENTNDCVQCSQLSCSTGTCDPVLGCECINNVCTHTGRRCIGSCNTKGDCGDGCTCHENQCVPCEFFSCANDDCTDKEGCACNGSKCEKDEDYECGDTLEIVKVDASCDIKGELTKDRCCGCPTVTGLLSFVSQTSSQPDVNYAGTHTIVYKWELFKGNGIEANNRLDKHSSNPNIADNEEASIGNIRLSIVVGYSDGSSSTFQSSSSIVGQGTLNFGPLTIPQKNNKPLSSVDSKRVISYEVQFTSDKWTFPNTCIYTAKEIGRKAVTTNTGFNTVAIQGSVSNSDCRNPLFVWYKSSDGNFSASSRIRTIYVSQDTTGKYIDTLPQGNNDSGIKYVESCNHYKLEADCSCDVSSTKYIVFCKPTNYTATIDPTSCGKKANVEIPPTCHANENKKFNFLVNGTKVVPTGVTSADFLIPSTGLTFVVTNDDGIKTLELKLICDTGNECASVWKKTFTPPTAPISKPIAECYTHPTTGDEKVKFTFTKIPANPWIAGGITMVNASNNAALTGSSATGDSQMVFVGDFGVTYNYTVNYACGKYSDSILKKNCCDAIKPELDGDCNGLYATNLFDATTVAYYSISGHNVSKTVLAAIDLSQEELSTFTTVEGNKVIGLPRPLQIGYVPVDSSCPPGTVGINLGNCCENYIINPITTFTGLTGEIYFETDSFQPPLESGEVLYISVDDGAYVQYTVGTGVTIPVNKGSVGVKIKRGVCIASTDVNISSNPLESGTIDCDITDVAITQEDCKYKAVVVEEVLCQCPRGAFTPTITDVRDVTIGGELYREIDIRGELDSVSGVRKSLWGFEDEIERGSDARALIESCVLFVNTGTWVSLATLNDVVTQSNQEISATIRIPCNSANYPAPVDYLFNYYIAQPETLALTETVTLKICVSWPASSGESVIGVSVNTGDQVVAGTATSNYGCFDVVGLTRSGSFEELTITFTLSNGEEVSKILYDVLYPGWAIAQGTYQSTNVDCEDCMNIIVGITNVEFYNGCKYKWYGHNRFEEWENTGAITNEVCDTGAEQLLNWQGLLPYEEFARKIRLDWYESGQLIKVGYTDGGGADPVYLDGTLPSNPDDIEFGDSYTATANCICSVSADISLCMKPKVTSAFTTCVSDSYYSDGSSTLSLTYSLSTCYAARTIYLYNSDGTLIDTATTSGTGAVTARVVELTEGMAGLENDFNIYASFDVSCDGTTYHVSRTEVNLTWTVTCAGDDSTYDLVFTGSPTLELISGSGTVNGSSIEGITNADTVEFKGVINGCASKIYTYDYDCTISPTPSPTPTVSRSVTKSLQTTPSRTPSVTRTRSVSTTPFVGGGGIIIASPSRTRTPSRTASITPTITKSSTPGASQTPTPSRTASATPSLTVSPSEGASPSVTKTITPTTTPTITTSRTATQTPTPTKTPTKTPSASACNPDCAAAGGGNYTGPLCGGSVQCCGGLQLSGSEECCNGSIIDPTQGDVCCSSGSSTPTCNCDYSISNYVDVKGCDGNSNCGLTTGLIRVHRNSTICPALTTNESDYDWVITVTKSSGTTVYNVNPYAVQSLAGGVVGLFSNTVIEHICDSDVQVNKRLYFNGCLVFNITEEDYTANCQGDCC